MRLANYKVLCGFFSGTYTTSWFETNFCQHPYRGSWIINSALSSVAFTGTLPVVLIKSAPALIEISDALRISAGSFSSPVSIIAFSKEPASAQAFYML